MTVSVREGMDIARERMAFKQMCRSKGDRNCAGRGRKLCGAGSCAGGDDDCAEGREGANGTLIVREGRTVVVREKEKKTVIAKRER
jgi:hypothetical protein